MSTQTIAPADPYDALPLAAYLEGIVVQCLEGMNTRDLLKSNVWPIVADDFTTAGLGYTGSSKVDFAEDYLGYREQYPDHRITVTEMNTSFDAQMIAAHIYTQVDVTGGHSMQLGMSRKVVIVCDFKKREGRWLLVGATSLPGEGGVVE